MNSFLISKYTKIITVFIMANLLLPISVKAIESDDSNSTVTETINENIKIKKVHCLN